MYCRTETTVSHIILQTKRNCSNDIYINVKVFLQIRFPVTTHCKYECRTRLLESRERLSLRFAIIEADSKQYCTNCENGG